MNETQQDCLIPFRTVASILNLSTRVVYRLVASGEFPRPVKVGGATRFYRSDLNSSLNRLRTARETGLGARRNTI